MSERAAISDQGTIAVVLKGYPRLSETFIAQELHGLERLGFKLRFVSLRHPTDRKVHPIHDEIKASVNYLPEYLHDEPWRVLKGVAVALTKRGCLPAVWQWLRDLSRDFTRNRIRRFGQACVMAAELPSDVHYIYAHFIHTPAAVAGYAATITGKPWACSAHAKDIWTSPDWELRQNLAATEWVATCTRIGWQHLRDLAGNSEKTNLIYHGLDLTRFPSPPSKEGAPSDGSQAHAPVQLLSVGRAVEKKGFDVLLAALAKLPADLHWQWTHIGGGAKLTELQTAAQDLKISDRISWQGAQSQAAVLEAYRNADLFVLPCRVAADGDRDGLPNVLVEAQSQRLACISTPVSGIPELISDDETGLLVAPDDAVALSAAITDLCRDTSRRATLAAAGEAHVRAAFDMHAGLTQLTALFPSDLARPPANAKADTLPEAAE